MTATSLDISVVVPTFNRAAQLAPLLDCLLGQDAGDVRYEVLIVNNNSTDDTKAVVQRAVARDTTHRLRYVVEPRQGVSWARNTGIEATTAPVIGFLDDDGVPARDWVREMKRAFDEHPEADCIGGRVTSDWRVPPPSWMEAKHTGPIALQDWPDVRRVNARHAMLCLITANLGVRREVFARIGGFSPDYVRNEDHELQLRMWRAGMQGLYLPTLVVTVDVPAERLTRAYHWRWRATTGKYQSLMRFRDSVAPDGSMQDAPVRGRRFAGVPLFMYREFLGHVGGFARAALTRRSDDRFFHETRLCYWGGYFMARWRDRGTALPPHVPVLRMQTPADDRPSAR